MMAAMGELAILHRDDDTIVVSKPGGILVHRSAEARDRTTLLRLIVERLGERPAPVHRIDRAASGIVVFARSARAARRLQAAMASPLTRKEYLVLARGAFPEGLSCFRPLRNPRGEPRATRTTFERLETFERCTLLRVRIFTGRRHQIRRHLNHLGHHVVGDVRHGKGFVNRYFRQQAGLERLFLHHTRLILHREGEEPLRIEDPLPPDLASVIDRLAGRSRDGRSGSPAGSGRGGT